MERVFCVFGSVGQWELFNMKPLSLFLPKGVPVHRDHLIIDQPTMAPPQSIQKSNNLSSMIAQYEKQLDNLLSKYPAMLKLERKVGIRKTTIVAGSLGIILGYGLLQLAATMVLSIIIFGYPAFMTMKAIESGQKADHSMWLSYWVCAAALQLFEAFTLGALSHIVPFYSVIIIGIHVWLFLPMTQGSMLVFESVLRPSFKSLIANPQFAAASERLGSIATKAASEVKKVSEDLDKKFVESVVKQAKEVPTDCKDD